MTTEELNEAIEAARKAQEALRTAVKHLEDLELITDMFSIKGLMINHIKPMIDDQHCIFSNGSSLQDHIDDWTSLKEDMINEEL
jgi:hypothetical protein